MKGLYSLMVGLLLLLFSNNLSAQTPLSVTIESGSAPVNQQLCVEVTGEDFEDILGFQFSINYDETVLQFVSGSGAILVGQPVFVQNSAPGDVRVTWNTFSSNGITSANPFQIAELCFTVLVETETDIVISSMPITAEFSDLNGAVSNTQFNNGTVNEGTGTQPNCMDGIQNGNETGVDCGGPDCMPCQTSSCSDGIQNGNETGVDCGGPDCMPCQTSSCSDGIQNGNETGVDCGGPDCAPCTGGNEEDLFFFMSSTSGAVGTEVCLNVTTSNFDSIGAFQYSINYDASVLDYESASNLAFPDINVVQPASTPGQIRVSWVYFQPDTEGETLADGSTVFTICFTVLQPSGTNVVFSDNPIGIEGFDSDGNELIVVLSNGTVNGGGDVPTCNDGIQNGNETGIDCGGNCAPCDTGNNEDLIFNLGSANGAVGTEVCVNVTTQNFDSIGAFQFSINYDANILDYEAASNLAFPDINVVQPASTPGQIRVSWVYFEPDTEGETLVDNSVVFTICFTVLQATGTPVIFSNNPIGIEGFDSESNELVVVTNNGSINGGGPLPTCSDGVQNGSETGVDCGGPDCVPCMVQELCGEGSDNLNFCVDDVCADVNEQVCIDIATTNFNTVAGFQFQVNYAGGNLEYVSGTSHPNLTGGATIFSPNDGQVRVLWNDPTPEFTGASIPDGENVVVLCFTNEVAQTTPILLSLVSAGTPDGNSIDVDTNPGSVNDAACNGNMPTCFDGVQNGNETGVDCGGPDCVPCNTGGNDCTVSGNQLTVCTDEVCADVNEQFCLDIDVTNFTSVVGFEFKVIYPGANLDYVASSGTSNPALTGGATINNTNDGEIRILWFDPTPQFEGATIAGTDFLVNLCFINQSTATSQVQIIDESFSNPNGEITSLNVNDGSVNAPDCGGNPATCTDGIQNGNETGVDCGGPDCAPCSTMSDCTVNGSDLTVCTDEVCGNVGEQVCLDIDVTNFTDVVGFEFKVIYPGANLDYVASSGTSNPALTGGATINNVNDGEIRILWFDPTPQFEGATIAGTDFLVNLCFTVENAGTSAISLIDESFSDNDGVIDPVAIFNGSINGSGCNGGPTCTDGIQNGNETGVDCGGPDCPPCQTSTCTDGIQNGNETGVDCGGPDCAPCQTMSDCTVNGDELTLCVDELCGNVGEQVCLDIDVTNFTDVVGFEFKVIYPGANLDYVASSGTSNPALLGGATINNVNDGEIRVLWFDPTPQFEGATIAGTDFLVNLCFTVENAGESMISLTDDSFSDNDGVIDPVVIFNGSINGSGCNGGPNCTDGIQNGNETGVDCGGPDCQPCQTSSCNDGIQNGNETGIDCGGPDCAPCMTMNDCVVNGDELTLCVEEVCADVGEQVCLDIDVTNFTDVVGFEFKVFYPGANLDYVASSGTSNPALLGGATINNVNDGEIRVLWFDPTPQFEGATIAGTDFLVNLCFTVEAPGESPVTIQDESFSDTDGTIDVVTIYDGSVNGSGCGGGPVCNNNGVQDGLETGIDCGGPVCPPCTSGQEDLSLNVSSANVSVGEQACLDVTVQDFNNMGSLDLTLNYDETALQVSSIIATDQLPNFGAGNFTVNQDGTIAINWTGAAGAALNDNTVLFTVCFTALTEGTTNVTFDGSSTGQDGDGNQVTLLISGGTVSAVNNFDELTFVMGSNSAPENSEVCLDILTYNFTDITSFSFTINYDPLKLDFNSLNANPNFPPGGSYQVSNPSPGEIRVIWLYNPPDFAGITVPDGTSVGQVCFDVLIACETPVQITGSATDIAATDNNGTSLDVTTLNGTVNAGIPCDGGCSPDNLVIDIQNGSGLAGEEVCVDVLVDNFTSLTELSFTLNYDASVLDFSQITNLGLGSITLSDFTIGPAGTITFDWTSPSPLGQTIADGGTMFTLCFTVVDVVQTPVNFANSPVPFGARNGCGANVGIIPMNGMINPNAPVGDDLTMVMCCVDGAVGDVVEVEVKIFNFEEIVGFQFSADYDPAKLQFVSAGDDTALPLTFITNSAPGDIRVSWNSPDGTGETLPDGVVLCSFRFMILDTDAATVTFSDQPILIEFIDSNSNVVPVTLINCAVNGSGAPTIVSAVVTPPTCNGDADGSIELTVTGPTNISYNWIPNPSGSTGPLLENLGPGTYTVQVVNNDTGESTSESYTIMAPPPLFFVNTVVEDVSCTGAQDGAITITPQGGAMGNYTIDWSGNLQDGLLMQSGLDEGNYSVSVTDANGCQIVLDTFITEPASLPNFNGLVTDIGAQPGAVDITVVAGSGTPDYNFSWSGPGGYTAGSQSISGLTVAGTYCLIMLDANGCAATQCFVVEEVLRISNVVITEGCFGSDGGSIDISVTGGDGNYGYSWTGPNGYTASSEDISNLEPGVYQVTVTSGTESVTGSYTLEEAAAITTTAVVTSATSGNDGAIDLTPAGGTQPYTYLWSNGETTQDLMNLEPGTYCVTVTDSQGCMNAGSENCFTVSAEALAVATVSTTATSCFDSEDGQAVIVMNNGVAPFTAVTDPGGVTVTSGTDTLTLDLAGGTYNVTITDNQGSTVMQEVIISAPSAVTLADTSIVSDTEDAECTGSITIVPAGGTPPYEVSWNVPLSGPQITGLCAGEYMATVVDANGCTFQFEGLIIGQLTESAVTTMVECSGDMTGVIDLTVEGGVAPYSFAWRVAGTSDVIATTEDLEGVGAGTYEVTIIDETGATLVRSYSITTSLGFSVSASAATNYNGFGVSCDGAADGTLVADVSGLGTYSYEWFRNGELVGIDSVLTGVPAGTYTLVVLSDAGCEIAVDVDLDDPNPLVGGSEVVDVSCFNERDGLVRVELSGGVPPYTYEWSNGSSLSQIQFLSQGDYSLVVTDANGCTFNETYQIAGPPELVVTFEATDATDGCNGTVTLLPLAGSGMFNYNWLQLPRQGNNPVARDLCPGEYTVEISDENRCQSVTITTSVRDRRFPCLSERNVITPNGDGLNENFILFCSDGGEVTNNTLQIFNRWGQLVYEVANYNCSEDGGLNCFEGRTNDGSILPAGPYYYVLDYTNPLGEVQQQRGSITILLE